VKHRLGLGLSKNIEKDMKNKTKIKIGACTHNSHVSVSTVTLQLFYYGHRLLYYEGVLKYRK